MHRKLFFVFGFATALVLIVTAAVLSTNVNQNTATQSQTEVFAASEINEEQSTSPVGSQAIPLPVVSEDPASQVETTENIHVESAAVEEIISQDTLAPDILLSEPTEDIELITSLLQEIAEKEALMIDGHSGWYHAAVEYYAAGSSQDGVVASENGNEVHNSDLIPPSPITEKYVRFDIDKRIDAGIGFLRDKTTEQIMQVSIWDGDFWVNTALREAGLSEDRYKTAADPIFFFPAQSEINEVLDIASYGDALISAEQVGDVFRITIIIQHDSSNPTAGVSEPVAEVNFIKEFSISTGQFLYSDIHALTTAGEKVLLRKHRLVAQEILTELPNEITQLHELYGFPLD